MAIIAWISFGLVAGILTKLVLGGRGTSSLIMTTAFGIAGAVVGGFISLPFFRFDAFRDFNLGGMIMAIGGATLVLLAYGVILKGLKCRMATPK